MKHYTRSAAFDCSVTDCAKEVVDVVGGLGLKKWLWSSKKKELLEQSVV